jgi:anti-sigma regulatory factor (Ser/Thr protein kinase)
VTVPNNQSALVKLDSVGFDRLLARQKPITQGVFDLTEAGFIAPAGLIALTIAVESATEEHNEVIVRIPDLALRTYLARCGFLRAVHGICRVEPDASTLLHAFDHRVGRSPMLIELTRLSDQRALMSLLDRAIDAVELVRGTIHDAYDVAALLSELGGNALEHGGGHGYLAMQVYGEGRRRFLELSIGDRGPGIRRSLQSNPAIGPLAGDLHAIQTAVQPKVSGSTEPTRGSGLYQLLRLVREHGGSVQIRSGAATARWRTDRPSALGLAVPHLSGTQVTFSLPSVS